MSRREPIADLGLVHEFFRDITFGDVPFIEAAEEGWDEELDGAELVPGEGFEGVFENIGHAVIESEDGFAGGIV
jgi:hypothetical protein